MPLKRQLLNDCQYKVSGRHNNLNRRGDTVRTESECGSSPKASTEENEMLGQPHWFYKVNPESDESS